MLVDPRDRATLGLAPGGGVIESFPVASPSAVADEARAKSIASVRGRAEIRMNPWRMRDPRFAIYFATDLERDDG